MAKKKAGQAKKGAGTKRKNSEIEADPDADPLSVEEIQKRIQAHDRHFCSLLDLIPAEFLFHSEETDERSWNKYYKGPSQTEKLNVKAQSKRAKKAKFDPANQKTNVELQQERAEAEKEQKQLDQDNKAEEQDDEEPFNGTIERDDDDEPEEEEEEEEEQEEEEKGKSSQNENQSQPNGNKEKSEIEKLRERLHAKLAAIKGSRQPKNDRPNAKMSQKKRKKLKQKDKEHLKKQKQREEKKAAAAAKGASKPAKGATAEQPVVANGQGKATENIGNLKYSSLIIDDKSADNGKWKKEKKGPNTVHLLEKAELKQQRMHELSRTDEGKQKLKKENWHDAIDAASGNAKKDDIAALRRKVKSKEKKKTKTKKEWGNRVADAKSKERAKQDKRRTNLDERVAKKQVLRPGFEGAHGSDFLNE